MSRRYVSQFGHQEAVNEILLVSDKQLRPNRNGNLYLQMELSDRTGTIGARMWNASDVVQVVQQRRLRADRGTTQLFQGAMQLIANRVGRVDPSEINADDFMPLAAVEVDKLVLRLGEILRGMQNRPCRRWPSASSWMNSSWANSPVPRPGSRITTPTRRTVAAHSQPDGGGAAGEPLLPADRP